MTTTTTKTTSDEAKRGPGSFDETGDLADDNDNRCPNCAAPSANADEMTDMYRGALRCRGCGTLYSPRDRKE
jgi:hypothetical protein